MSHEACDTGARADDALEGAAVAGGAVVTVLAGVARHALARGGGVCPGIGNVGIGPLQALLAYAHGRCAKRCRKGTSGAVEAYAGAGRDILSGWASGADI